MENKLLHQSFLKGAHSEKYTFHFNLLCFHRVVFIDFDTLQANNPGIKVQRLSFLPQGQAEDIGWYFRDDQLWCEYGTQVRKIAGINSLNSLEGFLWVFLVIFLFRVPTPCHHQSAVDKLNSSSPRTLREPSDLQWAVHPTWSISPVCGVYSDILLWACSFIQLWKCVFISLCSHDAEKPHHRLTKEAAQASKIILQHWSVRLFSFIPVV